MKRNLNYEYMRVLATICVIGIHSSSALPGYYASASIGWFCANIVHTIFRIGLPIFVLLSGALLLGKKYDSIGNFYLNRVERIIIPYILYSLFWTVYLFYTWGVKIEGGPFVRYLLEKLINGGVTTHLWFMGMIISVYIATPFLAKLIQNLTRNELMWFLAIILFFQQAKIFLSVFGVQYDSSFEFFINTWSVYYVLGYYIKNVFDKYKRKYIYFCGIVALVYTLVVFALCYGKLYANIYDLQISMVMMCCAVMCFFEYDFKVPKSKVLNNCLVKLSTYCFSVYMIHPFIIPYVDTLFMGHFENLNIIISVLIKVIVVFIVSVGVSVIIDNTIVAAVRYLFRKLFIFQMRGQNQRL